MRTDRYRQAVVEPADPARTDVVTEPFESLVERVADEAAEGFFHTAAQLVVVVDGDCVLDTAVGTTHLKEPFERSTLSALYCAAKPLVAVATLQLVAEGELSLDDRLGDVVDGLDALGAPWIAQRTIEQVLGHTAGLHVINTVLARILPERSREAWLVASEPPVAWRFGVDRAYAEFGGWYLLGKAIESLTERPYEDHVTDAVLLPYGVEPYDLVVRFDEQRYDRLHDRISATYDLTMDQPVPLLAEVGPETACEWNPSFGTYGTMSALATFYQGLLADLDGAELVLPASLLSAATAARLPIHHDVVLDRDAGFGLGFMTPLSSHFFGDGPSPRAFGHAGQGGTSFAMADPDHGIVLAVLYNAGLDADTALAFRRVNLVDAVYRALGV